MLNNNDFPIAAWLESRMNEKALTVQELIRACGIARINSKSSQPTDYAELVKNAELDASKGIDGFSIATYYRLKNGQCKPKMDLIALIEKVLDPIPSSIKHFDIFSTLKNIIDIYDSGEFQNIDTPPIFLNTQMDKFGGAIYHKEVSSFNVHLKHNIFAIVNNFWIDEPKDEHEIEILTMKKIEDSLNSEDSINIFSMAKKFYEKYESYISKNNLTKVEFPLFLYRLISYCELISSTWHEKLKKIKIIKGISQIHLAKELNLTQPHIYMLLNAKIDYLHKKVANNIFKFCLKNLCPEVDFDHENYKNLLDKGINKSEALKQIQISLIELGFEYNLMTVNNQEKFFNSEYISSYSSIKRSCDLIANTKHNNLKLVCFLIYPPAMDYEKSLYFSIGQQYKATHILFIHHSAKNAHDFNNEYRPYCYDISGAQPKFTEPPRNIECKFSQSPSALSNDKNLFSRIRYLSESTPENLLHLYSNSGVMLKEDEKNELLDRNFITLKPGKLLLHSTIPLFSDYNVEILIDAYTKYVFSTLSKCQHGITSINRSDSFTNLISKSVIPFFKNRDINIGYILSDHNRLKQTLVSRNFFNRFGKILEVANIEKFEYRLFEFSEMDKLVETINFAEKPILGLFSDYFQTKIHENLSYHEDKLKILVNWHNSKRKHEDDVSYGRSPIDVMNLW